MVCPRARTNQSYRLLVRTSESELISVAESFTEMTPELIRIPGFVQDLYLVIFVGFCYESTAGLSWCFKIQELGGFHPVPWYNSNYTKERSSSTSQVPVTIALALVQIDLYQARF